MKIRTKTICNTNEGGQYTVSECDDFEYVNPVHQFMMMYVQSSVLFDANFYHNNGLPLTEEVWKSLLLDATQEWEQELSHYRSIVLPEKLLSLLTTTNKKDQIQLLKGLTLTSDELISFIIEAHEKHGYSFSQYTASHFHKGFDPKKLPKLIHLDGNQIITVGDTSLSNGQQKQVVEQRRMIVSKFLDKGDHWHCFFITSDSLKGKEQYAKPHLHYISSEWNLSREDVKIQLKNRFYSLPTLPHIDFHTHRNPRD